MTPEQQASLRLARVRLVVANGYHETVCDRIRTMSRPCNCWKAQILAALDGPLS